MSSSKSRSKWSKGARKTIPFQFTPRSVEMMESPAWRVLSLSAHRLLDRLDIEHRHHGGCDNGKLIVTFEQFCGYGMDRHAVARAIREAVALGFVRVTRQGCAGNADQRQASQYRLTYQPAEGVPGYGSNEWHTITTLEEANGIAVEARRTPAAGPNGRRVKIRKPVGVNATFQCAKPTPINVRAQCAEPPLQPSVQNPHYYQYLGEGGRASDATGTGTDAEALRVPTASVPASKVIPTSDDRRRRCKACGGPMTAKRRHAMFCSGACRVRAHHRRARSAEAD